MTVRAGRRASNGATHTRALAVLQQALRDKALVWVGYVDAHGATASRLVRPVSMGAGYLRAEDERTEMLHTFALHRITAAVLEDDAIECSCGAGACRRSRSSSARARLPGGLADRVDERLSEPATDTTNRPGRPARR